MTHNIAQAIRNNNLTEYQQARYPVIQDGEVLSFVDESFVDTDFGQFPMGFSEFKHCDLTGAKNLFGQPISFRDSKATMLDIRGCWLIIDATNSDFSGLRYDDETRLTYRPDPQGICSTFQNCVFDEDAKAHFEKQGVVFTAGSAQSA